MAKTKRPTRTLSRLNDEEALDITVPMDPAESNRLRQNFQSEQANKESWSDFLTRLLLLELPDELTGRSGVPSYQTIDDPDHPGKRKTYRLYGGGGSLPPVALGGIGKMGSALAKPKIPHFLRRLLGRSGKPLSRANMAGVVEEVFPRGMGELKRAIPAERALARSTAIVKAEQAAPKMKVAQVGSSTAGGGRTLVTPPPVRPALPPPVAAAEAAAPSATAEVEAKALNQAVKAMGGATTKAKGRIRTAAGKALETVERAAGTKLGKIASWTLIPYLTGKAIESGFDALFDKTPQDVTSVKELKRLTQQAGRMGQMAVAKRDVLQAQNAMQRLTKHSRDPAMVQSRLQTFLDDVGQSEQTAAAQRSVLGQALGDRTAVDSPVGSVLSLLAPVSSRGQEAYQRRTEVLQDLMSEDDGSQAEEE